MSQLRATIAPTFFLVALCLTASSGCYTPSGAFVPIDSFSSQVDDEYVISVGDVLMVRVFQQDAVSSRVRVRPDGRVSLPLVNDWTAAGKTPTVLANELKVKLKDFINNPVVTVSLEEARPLMVSVVGEVTRQGVVTLEAGAGVLQAIAAAGGLTDFAHRDGIFVLRKTPGSAQPLRVRFTLDALTRGEGKAGTFALAPQDVVVAE